MRVISLVPSWTEFLYDLNVDVVGQTKYCVRPKSKFHTGTRIGGTKNIKVDQILALKPDLVLANREENDQMQVEHLSQHLPADGVMLTDVRKIEDAWIEMARIGERVERFQHTRDLLSRIQDVWGNPRPERGKAGYVVWPSPWMVAGQDTYIHDVMRHWGIRNAIGKDVEGRYPSTGDQSDVGATAAYQWLLPSEPFPFQTKHLHAFQSTHSNRRFRLVDGESFSWYGSRMLHAAEHLEEVAQWVSLSPKHQLR